uniref:Uncharacterized protein n=1 Tax=Anguilla anguilla TaxID=7936 RepID=A0A0E9W4P8_ANGAN
MFCSLGYYEVSLLLDLEHGYTETTPICEWEQSGVVSVRSGLLETLVFWGPWCLCDPVIVMAQSSEEGRECSVQEISLWLNNN